MALQPQSSILIRLRRALAIGRSSRIAWANCARPEAVRKCGSGAGRWPGTRPVSLGHDDLAHPSDTERFPPRWQRLRTRPQPALSGLPPPRVPPPPATPCSALPERFTDDPGDTGEEKESGSTARSAVAGDQGPPRPPSNFKAAGERRACRSGACGPTLIAGRPRASAMSLHVAPATSSWGTAGSAPQSLTVRRSRRRASGRCGPERPARTPRCIRRTSA